MGGTVRRAAITADTKQAALKEARALVLQEGGGEIRVIDRTGKIVSARAVNRPKSKAA
jgi:hypothetical protein